MRSLPHLTAEAALRPSMVYRTKVIVAHRRNYYRSSTVCPQFAKLV